MGDKMKHISAVLAVSVATFPFVAVAQPLSGIYIGAGAGVNFHQQEAVNSLATTIPGFGTLGTAGNSDIRFNTGFVGLGSVGWGFGNGLRAEIEGDYRHNSNNGFTNGGGLVAGGGQEQKYGGMVNVLYDFVGVVPWVQPYAGVGIGVQWVEEHNLRAYNAGTVGSGAAIFGPGGINLSGSGTKAAFAYQAILGAALPVEAVPGLALTAEYRFLGTAGDRTYGGTIAGITTAGARAAYSGTVKLGPTYDHAILFGVRYAFGQTPPPPAPAPLPVAAPAPAVQPARSYLVFFDWDKATLTGRARQIIKEAADNSTHVQYTQIEVNGYTDTSGTPQYNQRLSVRRAEAVAAELVRDGVPKTAIAIQGFGETHLLVPTGPNVREPQNRRVEIIIR